MENNFVYLEKPFLRPESILNDFKKGKYKLIKEYPNSYLIEDKDGLQIKLNKRRFKS